VTAMAPVRTIEDALEYVTVGEFQALMEQIVFAREKIFGRDRPSPRAPHSWKQFGTGPPGAMVAFSPLGFGAHYIYAEL
jgi:hypothetical protein